MSDVSSSVFALTVHRQPLHQNIMQIQINSSNSNNNRLSSLTINHNCFNFVVRCDCPFACTNCSAAGWLSTRFMHTYHFTRWNGLNEMEREKITGRRKNICCLRFYHLQVCGPLIKQTIHGCSVQSYPLNGYAYLQRTFPQPQTHFRKIWLTILSKWSDKCTDTWS